MKNRLTSGARIVMLPILVVLTACGHHRHHGGGPAVNTYAVPDALAVGSGLQPTSGNFATAYYAPTPVGSPGPAASLSGNGQVVYAPDGTLYRYSNGTGGCAINKYAFGAIGSAQPLATATGDSELTGSVAPLGCYAATTDSSGNLYVLVANGAYLGIDIFDSQLAFQRQLGNGPQSGIFASGSIPLIPLAIDGALNLYVGLGTTIAIFDGTLHGDVTAASTFPVANPAISLLADSSGNLYVGSKSTVSVFPQNTNVPSSVLTLPTDIIVPSQSQQIINSNSLALDSQSSLYVLTVSGSTPTSQVLRYNANSVGNALPVAKIPVDSSAKSISVAP